MSATTEDVLGAVASAISGELEAQRAAGVPLKAAWHAVARAFGCITPRRVRAIHYGEVEADDIRAREWLAAQDLRSQRLRARIAAARELLAEESSHNGTHLP